MKKRKNRILEGARQALAIAKGELDPSTYVVYVPDEIDVKAMRLPSGDHAGMTSPIASKLRRVSPPRRRSRTQISMLPCTPQREVEYVFGAITVKETIASQKRRCTHAQEIRSLSVSTEISKRGMGRHFSRS